MKAMLVAAVLAALCAAAPRAIRADGTGGPKQELAARLETELPSLLRRYGVPGASLALIADGEVRWEASFGWADVRRRVPMSSDTVFRAESISKSVSAWGVMRLALDGGLDLDAPVGDVLAAAGFSGAADWDPRVTARRLLAADAGMPLGTIGPAAEYSPGSPMPNLQEFLDSEPLPERKPGTGFGYSNLGYNALELLVETAAGRPFAPYMGEKVLSPLGMSASSFAWNERIASRLATGYDLAGRPVGPYVYPASAAGGLFVTIGDAARFAAASVGAGGAAGVLPAEAGRELQRAAVDIGGLFGFAADAYGYGHFVETLRDGRKAVWHGGQGHGWMTHFHAVPDTGDAVVILTNSQRSWPLIAAVLRLWADGRGLTRPKFSRIHGLYSAFSAAAWGILAAALAAVAVRAAAAALARRGGRKIYDVPLGPRARILRGTAAAAILAILAYAATRPSLMLSSIFPGVDRTAAAAALAAALNLALGAASGRRPRTRKLLGHLPARRLRRMDELMCGPQRESGDRESGPP